MRDESAVLMEQMVALEYRVLASPTQQRFDERMREGQLIGHRCPSCHRVYVPPKGYCPLCVIQTTRDHEVDVDDKGTVVSFTILTPIQYRGQKERQPYALASLLLDGADSTVGQQRIAGIALDDIRMGMRVRAEWNPPEVRTRDASAMAQWSIGKGVKEWVPTGEPDAAREQYQEHIL